MAMDIGFNPVIERRIERIRTQFFPATQVERRLVFNRRKLWSGSRYSVIFVWSEADVKYESSTSQGRGGVLDR